MPTAHNEAFSRILIDRALEDSGWNLLDPKQVQFEHRTADLIPALFQEMFGDPATNPKGWVVRTAGELMNSCDYETSHKANDDGRGISVLRMGNVTTDGQLDLEDLKNVELEENELSKQFLQADDVIFNRTNSRELVGKTGMWDGRFDAVAASYLFVSVFMLISNIRSTLLHS